MNNNMNNEKVNSEVLCVLMALGDTYVNKIPSQVMQYLIKNSKKDYIPEIDKNKRIEEQNISKEARVFLTMLKLKYWCKTEEEKEVLLNILNENEKKQQKEISEKYNPDNLFKKNNK